MERRVGCDVQAPPPGGDTMFVYRQNELHIASAGFKLIFHYFFLFEWHAGLNNQTHNLYSTMLLTNFKTMCIIVHQHCH